MGASESQMKSNRMWEKIHPMTRDRIKSTGMKRQRNEGGKFYHKTSSGSLGPFPS